MRAVLVFGTLALAFACSSPPEDDLRTESSGPGKVSRSHRGAVVSQAPLATEVGASVLGRGGNAVDAAVATAFALAVVEPSNSGLGGRTQILIRSPEGSFFAIDGTTQVPAAYPADTVLAPDAGVGYGAIGIPGTVAALEKALLQHGTWSLDQVLAPAVRLAQDGFPMTEAQARALAGVRDDLVRFEGSRSAFLRPDGTPYQPGDRFVQADLARTLRILADGGAAAFYEGEIAAAIAEDMEANGGYVEASDLASYRPRDALLVEGTYREHELVATYLPAAGANTIEMLQILEHFDLAPVAGSAAWAALVAQAVNLGFQDRLSDLARMGPAETFPLPGNAAELTSKSWAAERARAVRVPETVEQAESEGTRSGSFPEGHTTHLSVVDAAGGAVALTQSLGPSMGSRVVTPGLGFAYAATMGYLSGLARSSGVRALGPGDRASSRQSPMMVLRNGELWMVLGGSGSRRIVSALVQVVSRSVDQGFPLADAVTAARVHVEPAEPDVVHTEVSAHAAWSEGDRRFLRGFGFQVRDQHEQSFGIVSAVAIDPRTGELVGVADPRGAGSAAGPSR